MGESDKDAIRAMSDQVSTEVKSLINEGDIESLKQTQHLILGRLQDSNAVLSHFNEHSENCFTDVMADFTRNTRLMNSMKTDLDHIFLKLRSMKAKHLEYHRSLLDVVMRLLCMMLKLLRALEELCMNTNFFQSSQLLEVNHMKEFLSRTSMAYLPMPLAL